jgi:hypothetical protein
MDQTHLGQVTWQPPRINSMPAVSEVLESANDHFGVAIEGDASAWPDHYGDALLPVFDSLNPRRSYVEVFAEGTQAINFSIAATEPWIVLTQDTAPRADRRYWVEIDWTRAPAGTSTGTITVSGGRKPVTVKVPVVKATGGQLLAAQGRFASLAGSLAFAASAASARRDAGGVRWENVPDYGRGADAVAVYPVTAASVLPPNPAPQLEYPVYLPRDGKYELTLVLGPVMDVVPDRGMRIAVTFDNEAPEVLDIFADRAAETFLGKNWWERCTRDNARYLRSSHTLAAGTHTLKLAMVDPGVVVQKIILHDRPLPESYFGPPEAAPFASGVKR